MAKHYVLCTQDYTHVIPETTLEISNFNGDVVSKIDVPEKVFQYTKEQKLVFGSIKSAKDFITAHGSVFKLIPNK